MAHAESGRWISNVIEIAKIKKIGRFLFAVDIEKAFDSLDQFFFYFQCRKIWLW